MSTSAILCGVATATGPMPTIIPKTASGVIHVEAYGSAAGVSATLQIQGSISGNNWTNVGSAITVSGTTPVFSVPATAGTVNYAVYRINVTAVSGGSVSAWIGL